MMTTMKHTPSFYLAAALLTLFTASTLRAQSSFYVGSNSSGVTTNFTSGTSPFYNDIFIGFDSTASNNMLGVLNSGTLFQGNQVFVGNAGSSNSMVLSNGGAVFVQIGYIGSNAISSNNSVLVTGSGSRWTNDTGLVVGGDGSSPSCVETLQQAVQRLLERETGRQRSDPFDAVKQFLSARSDFDEIFDMAASFPGIKRGKHCESD